MGRIFNASEIRDGNIGTNQIEFSLDSIQMIRILRYRRTSNRPRLTQFGTGLPHSASQTLMYLCIKWGSIRAHRNAKFHRLRWTYVCWRACNGWEGSEINKTIHVAKELPVEAIRIYFCGTICFLWKIT